MRRLAILCVVWLSAAGCDSFDAPGSPTGPDAPTAPPKLTGTWKGTMTSSNFPTQSITMQLTQFNTGVTGTYRLSPRTDFTGSVGNGSVDSTNFSGLLFLNAGSACQSHGDFTGTVSENELHWTSSGFTVAVACIIGPSPKDLPKNVTISARR